MEDLNLCTSKLRTYKHLKKRLQVEKYLLNSENRFGRYLTTQLRSGSSCLRIERGRYRQKGTGEGLEVSERTCQICDSNDVEDECHFMLHCPVYDHLRDKLWTEIEFRTCGEVSRTMYQNDTDTLNLLIGKGAHKYYVAVMDLVKAFVAEAMRFRRVIFDKYVEPCL